MKKSILISVIAIFAAFGLSAQENQSLPRFIYDVGLGTSVLPGFRNNLSPWGVHYRDNFNRGFGYYAQASYIFQRGVFRGTSLGFKFSEFGFTGNYTLASGERVAENIGIRYFAPQFGWVRFTSPRILITTSLGIGYARYQSEGLLNDTAYSVRSHMLGSNVNLSLAYSFNALRGNNAAGIKLSNFNAHNRNGRQHREIGGETSTVRMDEMNQIFLSRIDFSLFWRVSF